MNEYILEYFPLNLVKLTLQLKIYLGYISSDIFTLKLTILLLTKFLFIKDLHVIRKLQ